VTSTLRRSPVLGTVGAAQELAACSPSVRAGVQPSMGGAAVFWINIPCCWRCCWSGVPPRGEDRERRKVSVTGGLLLAISLGLLVVGLYNPQPEVSVLPPWGPVTTAAGGGVFLLFLLWSGGPGPSWSTSPAGANWRSSHPRGQPHRRSRAHGHPGRHPAGPPRPCSARDAAGGALLLARFLAALPVGAIVGVCSRRASACAGSPRPVS